MVLFTALQFRVSVLKSFAGDPLDKDDLGVVRIYPPRFEIHGTRDTFACSPVPPKLGSSSLCGNFFRRQPYDRTWLVNGRPRWSLVDREIWISSSPRSVAPSHPRRSLRALRRFVSVFPDVFVVFFMDCLFMVEKSEFRSSPLSDGRFAGGCTGKSVEWSSVLLDGIVFP